MYEHTYYYTFAQIYQDTQSPSCQQCPNALLLDLLECYNRKKRQILLTKRCLRFFFTPSILPQWSTAVSCMLNVSEAVFINVGRDLMKFLVKLKPLLFLSETDTYQLWQRDTF